jgi:hypothetical protein
MAQLSLNRRDIPGLLDNVFSHDMPGGIRCPLTQAPGTQTDLVLA